MATQTEKAQVDIFLNTADAEKRLKELNQRLEELKVVLDKSSGAGKDERKKAKEEFKEITGEVKALKESLSKRVDIIINGELAGASINDLTGASKKLFAEFKKLPEGSEEFIAKSQQYNTVKEKLKEVTASASGLNEELSKKIELILSGNLTNTTLEQLRAASKQLNEELEKTPPELAEFAEKSKLLTQVDARIEAVKKQAQGLSAQFEKRVQLIIDGNFAGATMQELDAAAKKLWADLQKLAPATQEFIDKTKSLQQVETRLKSLQDEVKGTGGWWSKLSDEVKQFGTLALGYLGFQAITSQVSNIINKNAQLSDSLANVRQTTGLTAEEVDKLNKSLSKLDTRTAKQDLLDIAKIGGQFGVAKEELLSFTDAVNKTTVVLKSEFKGGAEEITTTIAGLRNVLGDIKTTQIDQDILHISNALIGLAQQGVATAPVVADFANRIGGVGISLGLSSSEVLGLSATLQELNVSTERGGTAISKILLKMTNETTQFAKVAGVPLQEFKTLVNTDIYSAFLKFVEGSKRGGESATAFAEILKDSEISGAGASEVISKLGNNTQLLGDKVKASGELISGTSKITEQYALKNETFGAELDKLGKKIYSAFSSDSISTFFKDAVRNTTSFVDSLSKLPVWIDRNSNLLIALSGATALYYANTLRSTAATVFKTTAEITNNAVKATSAALTTVQIATQAAYITITDLFTGRITLATAAQRLFNIALAANPIGLLITGITAAAVAINLYSKNTAQAIALEKEKFELQKALIKTNNDLSVSAGQYNEQIQKLNLLSPKQQQDLKKEIELKLNAAKATLEQIKADQLKIQIDASQPDLWGKIASAMGYAGDQITRSWQRGKEAASVYNDEIDKQISIITGIQKTHDSLETSLNSESIAMNLNAQTTAQYEEKLRLLKTAQQNVIINSNDYLRITKEIESTEKKLARPKAGNDDLLNAETSQKKVNEKLTSLYEQLSDIQISIIQDETEKEISILEAKYLKESLLAEKNYKEIIKNKKATPQQKEDAVITNYEIQLALEEKFQREKTNLIFKSEEQRSRKELKQDEDNIEIEYTNELNSLHEQLINKEITEENFKSKSLSLEQETLNKKLVVNQQYLAQELLNISSNYISEQKKLDDKFKKQEISEKQYVTQSEELQQISSDKKVAINSAYGEKLAVIYKSIAANLLNIASGDEKDELKKSIELVDAKVNAANKGSLQELELRKQMLQLRFEEENKALDKEGELYKTKKAELNNSLKQLDLDFLSEKAGNYLQAFSQLNNIIGSFNDVQTNKENAQLARDKKNTDQKKKHLDDLLKQKLISQSEYDKQVELLDKQQAEKENAVKLEQFERQKKQDRAQAIINTLVGITKTLSTYPWPWNAVFAALTAAEGYAAVAKINSQQPSFEKGTASLKESFIADGPSHAQQGIKLFDPVKNKVIGEIEGDEAVISAKTTSEKKDVINDLITTGGKNVVMKYADGGLLNKGSLDELRVQKALHLAKFNLETVNESSNSITLIDKKKILDTTIDNLYQIFINNKVSELEKIISTTGTSITNYNGKETPSSEKGNTTAYGNTSVGERSSNPEVDVTSDYNNQRGNTSAYGNTSVGEKNSPETFTNNPSSNEKIKVDNAIQKAFESGEINQQLVDKLFSLTAKNISSLAKVVEYSDIDISALKKSAETVLNQSNIIDRSASFNQYKQQSDVIVEDYKIKVSAINTIETTLHNASIKNFENEVVLKNKIAERNISVDKVTDYFTQVSKNLVALSDQKIEQKQKQIFNEKLAYAISDTDDGKLKQEEFKQIKNLLKEKYESKTLKSEDTYHNLSPEFKNDEGIKNVSTGFSFDQPSFELPQLKLNIPSSLQSFDVSQNIPPQLNLDRLIESTKVENITHTIKVLKELGYNKVELKSAEAVTTQNNSTLDKLPDLMENIHSTLYDIKTKGVKGVWSHREWKEGDNDINTIKDNARFGK